MSARCLKSLHALIELLIAKRAIGKRLHTKIGWYALWLGHGDADCLEVADGDEACKGAAKTMGTILIILLVLFLLGAVPSWPYSRNWGYYPSGLLGLVLIVVIILAVTGRL